MDTGIADFVIKAFESTILGAILLMVFWAIWKGVLWVGDDILRPLKERIITHIDTLDSATKSMEKTVEKIHESVIFQGDAIEKQAEVIATVAKADITLSEKIDRIDQNVDELREKANLFFGQQSREYQDRHGGDIS